MPRHFPPTPDRDKQEDAIRQLIEAFEKLSPEQQREHRRAQRRSWVIGELMLADETLTREQAEARVRKAEDM